MTTTGRRCENCGTSVSQTFVRCYGVDGRPVACPTCITSLNDIHEYV